MLGTGRLLPTLLAVIGLAGVVLGWRAITRAQRNTAIVALAAGLLSSIVGALHAANAAGGLGTGNGLAGAVLAVALGVVSLLLGGLALIRSRRA
ncbi:DUF6223 family protein [Actinoplanes sp. NBC_00393]|uniref:DUF6223 family protein n=1 Tax=Actinoplanes sp. NBC_00393 TaxID=2975953 RepID=UPI002E1B5034